MSTLGAIVDVLQEVPEAIGLVSRLVERIKNSRGEDRALLLANLEREANETRAAFERAHARLHERFDAPVTTPVSAQPGDKVDPGDGS